MNAKLLLIFLGFLFTSTRKEVSAKGYAFKGKGKINEAFGREQLCKEICSDPNNPKEYISPWNESHQICACWDQKVFRSNIEKEGCKPQKKLPVFVFGGEVYTCNQMCKQFITEKTSKENIQLREAYMCTVKMQYGFTSTCICDFKFE